MSSLSYAVSDSMTMLRRNLKHAQRYPSMTVSVVALPVMMLLLFNYVFGGALGVGIGGTAGGGTEYIDYVAPGIILMAATSGALVTAVGVCVDMTEGIVNRFRTMAISRASFLTGHVVGSVIQTLVSIGLVIGVALLMGFRPNATPAEWIAASGLLALLTLALTWLSAAIGLVAKTPETASNMPMPLQFLPFVGSAIVPPESMPTGLRWFAEYQPFTPIIETLRGLLMGTEIGNSGPIALAWCAGLTLTGYLWARTAFHRGARR
ncbi:MULTISPECIES: ABC transporter permease [unclassified Streptomyces]|uniref:ABC transporter permease n=1 Tax=unclassified Streptomyces TaxID=2593676 RepID=UPI00081E5874|nr:MULTISPECIES: ABC transporter permease [unclassified Streptomyces]MYZ36020.1 ABC transporter permease [Streptomyces sp. SID4917]SCF80263.1 ABC-2 type transport system permease protein [Streptomyces sp. MnatMP-M17]